MVSPAARRKSPDSSFRSTDYYNLDTNLQLKLLCCREDECNSNMNVVIRPLQLVQDNGGNLCGNESHHRTSV
jgi:hypothetical protein